MAGEIVVCLSNVVRQEQREDFFSRLNDAVLPEEQKQSSESFQTKRILSRKFI